MPKNEGPREPDRTLRLLALVALCGRKQKEQIQLLDKAGFGPSDIADMLDSTPKAISVRLAELRRAKRRPQRTREAMTDYRDAKQL
jgi:DNA-directed RNA polymerase specialized sigma24 family protein